MEIVPIFLHVGLGTFRPVQVEDLARHRMDSEYFEVSPEATLVINKAKREDRRIIAVGTTTVRALESSTTSNMMIKPTRGWTDKFIYPPYDFKVDR